MRIFLVINIAVGFMLMVWGLEDASPGFISLGFLWMVSSWLVSVVVCFKGLLTIFR